MPRISADDCVRLFRVAAALLRKFLQQRGELPKASLIAACPVNVRTESEKGQGGNHFGLMRVPLENPGIGVAVDAERIAALTVRTEALRA